MRLNLTQHIRLIDVDVTSRFYGNVRVRINPSFIKNQDDKNVEFQLTRKQATEFIRVLKAQRDRIKT